MYREKLRSRQEDRGRKRRKRESEVEAELVEARERTRGSIAGVARSVRAAYARTREVSTSTKGRKDGEVLLATV